MRMNGGPTRPLQNGKEIAMKARAERQDCLSATIGSTRVVRRAGSRHAGSARTKRGTKRPRRAASGAFETPDSRFQTLVSIVIRLVRPLDRHADVIGLLLRQLRQLHA